VQALFIASAFGVLLFLASAAALVLEPTPQGAGIWHLTLVVLAALNAASGFMVLGGRPLSMRGNGRWSRAVRQRAWHRPSLPPSPPCIWPPYSSWN
jgi:hypothetical protein